MTKERQREREDREGNKSDSKILVESEEIIDCELAITMTRCDPRSAIKQENQSRFTVVDRSTVPALFLSATSLSLRNDDWL